MVFDDFHDFWKIWKIIEKRNSFGANFGPILELIWNSAAPKTPLFARLLSQGTCRYTYPKKQHKEKVMWGRVQCKIGKQRLAKIMQTRSAGSFRGPGADFWPHRISKGVPKSTIFQKKNREKWGPKNGFKQTWFFYWFFIEFRMDFGLIFDVFFIPLPFAHATF